MRTRSVLSALASACLALAFSATALAEGVAQVVTVRLEGDPKPYLDLVAKSAAITKRLGHPQFHAAQATLAGEATREIYVWSEFPSLAALGEAAAALEKDAEWQALLKQFDATGRKVVSMSVWRDQTPAGVTPAPIQSGGVATALAVRVDGDPKAYFELLGRLAAASKRLGIPVPRIWQATLAGEQTRTIYIVTQHASMASLGEATAKLDADAQAQALIREADALGRKIVANSAIRHRVP